MRPSNQTPVATSLFRTAAAILVLLLAAWPLAAGAADESAEILTLKQCIEIVMEKSPALESAAQDVTKAEWQKKKAF
ncbi:MAG: hypothetical protein KKB20_28335, partial [Proteobacteria bacterium]|nr:hypothetical protein [Pseudomonadota bacterium]